MPMPEEELSSKVGGVAAILGAAILLAATLLHPSGAPPGEAWAAFAEYAADRLWVATHLAQLFGAVLMGGGLLSLSWRLRRARSGLWAGLGAAGALASLTLAGALQAVDGVALKLMVDRWSQAAFNAPIFEATFALRQVEIGLAAVTGLFWGLTAILYAAALLLSRDWPMWLSWLGFAGGAATLLSSILEAQTGFSDAAMALSMPSNLLLLLWVMLLGVVLLRNRRVTDGSA
jgi:hypothetical protein